MEEEMTVLDRNITSPVRFGTDGFKFSGMRGIITYTDNLHVARLVITTIRSTALPGSNAFPLRVTVKQ